jgi:hypothetical protein
MRVKRRAHCDTATVRELRRTDAAARLDQYIRIQMERARLAEDGDAFAAALQAYVRLIRKLGGDV